MEYAVLPGFETMGIIPQKIEAATSALPNNAITDPQRVGEVLNELVKRPYYGFDTETTGLDYMRDALHGISVATEAQEWYVFDNALVPYIHGLKDIHARDRGKAVVGHNLKFDLHFLERYGFRPNKIIDTMIAQRLLNENTSLRLKDLAYSRLGIEGLVEFGDLLKEAAVHYVCTSRKCGHRDLYAAAGLCPACGKALSKKTRKLKEMNIYDIPLEKLVPYAAKDPRLTLDLWELLKPELAVEGFDDLFYNREMPFLYVLMDMESAGVYIDQPVVSSILEEVRSLLYAADTRWKEITGGLNPHSDRDVAKYLFETLDLPVQGRTKTGNPSVDALTLLRLKSKDKTGAVEQLKTVRELSKLESTYLLVMQNGVNEDGRLRTSLNQGGTVTGRLSSSEPNLQNIPAKSDLAKRIRDAFIAEPGRDTSILVADYSQLELRIVAHMSEEPTMLKTFAEGGDPHQATGDMVGVIRRLGKKLNFGVVYGMGPRAMADNIEEDGYPRPKESETKGWLKTFEQKFPNIFVWKGKMVRMAQEVGYVETLLGRRRRLPDINSFDQSLRSRAERQAGNAPIQGSAADLIEVAMLDIAPYQPHYDARMLLQVHDELVFEVPNPALKEFGELVQEMMTRVGKTFNLRVDLQADPGSGHSWGSAKH